MSKTLNRAAFLLALAILLVSCAPSGAGESVNGGGFTDTYQIVVEKVTYADGQDLGFINVLSKFNAATGAVSPICQDPLCDHAEGSGCPLELGMSFVYYYVENNTLYWYVSDQPSGTSEIRSYSFDTGRAAIVHTFENPTFSGTHVFRCGYFWQRENSAERKSVTARRVRLSDGALTPIEPDAPFAYGSYDRKYIFLDEDADAGIIKGVFLAGIDMNGRENLFSADDTETIFNIYSDGFGEGRIFYAARPKDQAGAENISLTLRMYDIRKGESVTLVSDCGNASICAVKNAVYYLKNSADPPYLGRDRNERKDIYNATGGALWRIDLDDMTEEKCFGLPGCVLRGYTLEAVGEYVVIDYGRTNYDRYEVSANYFFPDGWYDYESEAGKITLNHGTGEYKIYPGTVWY